MIIDSNLQQIADDVNYKERIARPADPITIDIDNKKLARIIDRRIEDSRRFFESNYHLSERRAKNKRYLFGRQIDEKDRLNQLKIYESRYLDNVLYEIESSIKPLAMSRLPDLLVTPPHEFADEKVSEDISMIIDSDIKKRQNRIALGIAFKHLPVYFVGVIKCRWDAQINDFVFEVVHPERFEVDYTCQSNNADDMEWVAETLKMTVQQALIRFPKHKKDFIEELKANGINPDSDGNLSESQLATEIDIKEVWFSWEEPKKKKDLALEGDMTVEEKDPDPETIEFETINGVIWKYKQCILDKRKNPNFDWEGRTETGIKSSPDAPLSPITQQDVMMFATTGVMPPIVSTEVFRNYFEQARKPYFLMGYDQWHEIPYDETSRIEQNIRNQESIDDTGKRVLEKLKSRRKHIFSKDGGLEPKHIEEMDLDDPQQDILVQGNVRNVHTSIEPELVTTQEFAYLDEARERMYGLAGAKAIRGQVQSDVATTNQIAREADFTRADDMVEDTINAACEWMAQWSLQMIKLRYTEAHFRKQTGDRGAISFIKIKEDMIQDGMEVIIKASGTDKLRIKNQAMDMAKLNLIDPMSFYEDIGVSDPKGRTEKLLLFQTNPQEYLLKYAMGIVGVPAMDAALNGAQGGQTGAVEGAQAGTGGAPVGSPSPANPEQAPVSPAPAAPPTMGV